MPILPIGYYLDCLLNIIFIFNILYYMYCIFVYYIQMNSLCVAI